MPYLPTETLQKRIFALEEAVRALNLDYNCVRTALEQAELAVAHLSIEEASRRAGLLSLEGELASIRLKLALARSHQILASFPHELLRAIFMCASDEINDTWTSDTHLWSRGHWEPRLHGPLDCSYNRNDARLPFTLAAVNRRWRSVVLDFPDLWSFLGVPGVNDTNGAAILAYVQLRLSRSRSQGLDIVLAWPNSKWEDSSYYRPILDAVGSHTHRWRRASLTIPSGTPSDATQFLRLPMDRLESLTLAHNNANYLSPSLDTPTYLPHCPQLRFLRNHFLAEPISRTLPRLTGLTVNMNNGRPSLFWEAIRLLPALEHLNLDFHGVPGQDDSLNEDTSAIEAGPSARLALPYLRGLGLQGHYCDLHAWFDKLDMPKLAHFRISDVPSLDFMTRMLANIAPTVTTVTVYGLERHDAERLHNLAPLSNVKTLVLRDPVQIEPVIVRTLASREAARLPRLESIVVESGKIESAQAAHLADLMHVLHAHPENGIALSLVAKPECEPTGRSDTDTSVREWAVAERHGDDTEV